MKKMTDEDKDFLYIDLCARLPYYGLMVRWGDDDFNIIGVGFGRITLLKKFMSSISGSPLVEEVRPYLRPMSSMTEEEKKEYDEISGQVKTFYGREAESHECAKLTDWLNKHHFDYRIVPSTGKNMIESGLAIEAKEGMYKTNFNQE